MSMQLRPLDPETDRACVQEVLEAAPGYSLAVSGKLQPASAAAELFAVLPPNFAREQKFVLGVEEAGRLLGVVDILRGFPAPGKAHIGLLLFREDMQKLGYGRRAVTAIEELAKAWPEIHTLRLSVVESNSQALGFWQRMGFRETGERKPYENEGQHSVAILMEKAL